MTRRPARKPAPPPAKKPSRRDPPAARQAAALKYQEPVRRAPLPPPVPTPPAPRKQGESPPPECIVLSGGITGGPTHAVAGALRWDKGRQEKLGDFIERAKREARAAGKRSVIVRGLKW